MEYTGKNKSPYYGLWQTCLLLISVPTILFLIIFYLFEKFQDYPKILNCYASMGLGFGIGALFQFTCIIAGLFKGNFIVVVKRISNFFENLSVSFKFAVKYYFEDLKMYGCAFWFYFLIIVVCVILSIIGFYMYFLNITF